METIDLTTGSIYKHVRQIAIPASVGYLFNTLYNVIDTFYAGKLSTDSLAGMTISFPIFFIVIALSSGLGSGTTALNAIALGKKDFKTYHSLAKNVVILGIILSILVMFIAPALTEFLFNLSGASGEAKRLGINYTVTIFYGVFFFIMNSILNGFLNAQGDTKTYRNFLILGFLLNLILDPLFIYGWFGIPKMGTVGVALATVIVQVIGTIYMTFKVIQSPIFEFKRFLKEHFSSTASKNILRQGLPSSLNMTTIALGVFVINYFILLYGNNSTIAGYGAAVRIEQLVLLPALGLNIAVLTITGQSYGAENLQRIKDIYKISIQIGVVIMLTGSVIIYPFAPLLIKIFNNDPAVIEAGTTYLRIEVLAFASYVFLFNGVASMQGIKKPNFAVFIGLYRQIILPVTLFFLMGTIFNLGVKGIWFAIVIINWSAVLITSLYHSHLIRNIKFN